MRGREPWFAALRDKYESMAQKCEREGNAAIANGIFLKARASFRTADAYRAAARSQEPPS